MTITTANTYLARLMKSGADTDRYSQLDKELAIATLGHELVREIRSVTKQTVAITADTPAVTFSGITGFRPARLYNARVTVDSNYTATSTGFGVQKVDYDLIRQWRACAPERCSYPYNTGVPAYIGFYTTGVAEAYPTPAYTGTLDVWTWDVFVSFTPGSGASEVINIPEEFIYDWLQAVADFVQLDDGEARKEYLKGGFWTDLVRRASSAGSIGGNFSR